MVLVTLISNYRALSNSDRRFPRCCQPAGAASVSAHMNRILSCLAVVMLTAAAPATAAPLVGKVIPPSNSAVGQYVESIPTAHGNRPSLSITLGGSGSGGGGSSSQGASGTPSSALTGSQQRALTHQGPDGRAVAQLTRMTAPPRVSRSAASTAQLPRHGASADAGSGSAPASGIIAALTGGGSAGAMGSLLPALLVAIALGTGVLAIRRRRAPSN
jgi:hypothetical protein